VVVAPDEVGFESFVLARGGALLRFAFVLCGDHHLAQDLVQETLIKANRRWSSITRAQHPEAYLRRMIVNEYLSWRRRRRNTEIARELTGTRAVEDTTALHADRDEVWQLLGTLPRQQRAVLVLRYYEGLPDAEIASLLGCSPGTVRSSAARAFARLRAPMSVGAGRRRLVTPEEST